VRLRRAGILAKTHGGGNRLTLVEASRGGVGRILSQRNDFNQFLAE
jgi:hypothetical protein